MYKYVCVYTCAYVEQNVCIETVKSDSKDWKENNEQREQNIQLEDTSMQIRITAMQQTTRPLCKENSFKKTDKKANAEAYLAGARLLRFQSSMDVPSESRVSRRLVGRMRIAAQW